MAEDHLPSHFFKFIPPGFKFNLSLPKSFSRNFNNARLKKATLRRGCQEWLVDISDEGVFSDGWRKLVIENGVQELDFIVFKHQGNMVFDFLVFDQSNCERQYPNLYDEMDVEEPLTESYNPDKSMSRRKKNVYLSRKVDEFRVGDDYFVIAMTPSKIKLSILKVPMKFARSHGLINRMHTRTRIVLEDEVQRTWPAILKSMNSVACLTGWTELRVNNHVEAGDMCMFKIVKLGEVPAFDFYNIGKKPIKDLIQVIKETNSTIKTRLIQNDRRYFISTMKSYFKKAGLHLPLRFSRSNGLKAGEMVIRVDKGHRSWKVKLLNKNVGNSLCFGCGFNAFCKENGLREGDAFKLELVENNKDKPPIANFSLIVDSTPQEGDRHTSSKN